MGRITMFVLEECPHCQRAKGALKERGIPYTEISLSSHPHRRADMLALSDRLTVPQIFFNDQHIGGADDLMKVLAEWDDTATTATTTVPVKTPLERYNEMVASQPDPSDERLGSSTDPPVIIQPPPARPESDHVELPNGIRASVVQVTETLKELFPYQDLPYLVKIYTNCFTGAAAVKALVKAYNCTNQEAVDFGRRLQKRQLLHHVVDQHEFDDTADYYFRLQCHQTPEILNSYRIWTEPADPDSMALITRLKKMLAKIVSSVTDSQGRVNYKAARAHEMFPELDEAICELQTVDLSQMTRPTMIAFIINLYNMGITFAFCKVGIASTSYSRSAFFTTVKFHLGGHLYSFQDLENGILRGNRRAPYSFSPPFATSDPRHAFCLPPDQVDCRIHFALNCGAKSCPPVKTFTAQAIDEELRIVAQAFCEDDNNVMVDAVHGKLHLNKILSWYMVDFCAKEEELPFRVMEFLRGEKKEQLHNMLTRDPKSVSVRFMNYDWATNATEYVDFDAASLKPEYYTLNAALRAIW